jgi:sugar O-acyltransferase (sialic acid O-acetyltransferase NeuD family)
MASDKFVIYGNGSVARLVYNDLTHNSPHNVVAFCVDREFIVEKQLLNLPVVPFDEVVSHYPPADHRMFVAVGYSKVNKIREERYLEAKKAGYRFGNFIAKTAITYPDLQIGENCVIGSYTIVHPDVKIGNNVLIGAGCLLGHDVELGDHCFVSDHVAVSGWVKVRENCFFGTGATIRNKVNIGREAIIGAAAVIMEDVEERSVYFSEPSIKLGVTSDKLNFS